jgi:hypothetical protein
VGGGPAILRDTTALAPADASQNAYPDSAFIPEILFSAFWPRLYYEITDYPGRQTYGWVHRRKKEVSVEERIEQLIKANPIMVFDEGHQADAPVWFFQQCGANPSIFGGSL